MILARYLFTAEKIATPSEKFEAQKSVCPSDGYVCRAESVGVKVGAVVDINDRNDFVSTRFGDGFDHFAHFSVSDECYFHKKGFY